LRLLAQLAPEQAGAGPIRAPWDGEGLEAAVTRLRDEGEIVIRALPGARDGEQCGRELVRHNGQWIVRQHG
jgi:hypothetical protein